jgi:MFS family permease
VTVLENNKRRPKQIQILGSSFLSFILNSTVRFFIPVLLPFFIVSLNISVYLGSLLITAYWVGYTLFQIPSGIIGDRFGAARVNKISFILLTITFPFIYIMRQSYIDLIIIQGLLGTFSAFIYITDASLVQKWAQSKERASYVGLYQTGFFVGASFGEFLVLDTFRISLITPFIVIFSLLVAVSILNLIFVRDPLITEVKTVGKISRDIVYVCLIRFSAGFSYIGFLSLFSSFIVFDHISSFSNAYTLSWIPAIGGVIGSPIGGYLSRRHARGKPIFSIFPSALIGLSLFALPYLSVSFVFILSSLTGFFYGLYAGPSMSMASDVSGGDGNVSASSGIINFSSQIGGSISPIIVGYLFVIYGNFSLAFGIIGVTSLIFLIPPFLKYLK